jgi:peptidoglycan hydrolase CwlO-like protein
MKDEDLLSLLADIRAEARQYFDQTRRHFDTVAEEDRHTTQLLAENISHLNKKVDSIGQQVSSLDEKVVTLDQKIDATNARIEQTAVETQAMIKVSYDDLDRRVRILEGSGR